MAFSYITYIGTGAQQDFTFPFPYLAISDITVTVGGVSTAFTLINSSAVHLTSPPASGSVVQVRRLTNKVSAPVDFIDGSNLLERDLDYMVVWTLYVAQESADNSGDSTVAVSAAQAASTSSALSAAAAADAASAANTAATPRSIVKGGTGASTSAGALTNLGIVNVTTEGLINGSLTIPNMFPASYLITDSASPSSYNIFLPGGAIAGSLVFFRVSRSATKLFTLYDSGTLMDGIDRRLLWAGETVMLLRTSTGWTKVGGTSIPFRGAVQRSATQALTAASWQAVGFTSGSQDSSGLNLCYSAASQCFTAPRTGTYKFTANLSVVGVTAGSDVWAAFCSGNVGGPSGSPNSFANEYSQSASRRSTVNIATTFIVARGDLYGVTVQPLAGTTVYLDYAGGVIDIAMTYEEILTW